MMGNTTQN